MLASVLEFQFNMNARALALNLDGIGEEEALIQPGGGGNCLNWVVGHIVASRESILSLLGEGPGWRPELVRRYERGSPPITSAVEAPASLAAIMQAFAESQERIIRSLSAMPPAKLEQAVGERTRGQQLGFAQFHEAYHVGQVGLLRRLVGKEGAIR